ncbi:hypothetical protein IJ818_03090 [bacterium]|nr:hypothetical protein [bacterium]
MITTYDAAKQDLLNLNFKNCEQYFKKNHCRLELGYCELLQGNLENAKKMFVPISNNNPRAHWALRMIQFIERYVTFLPTYFEIRNFLEIDINLLIKAKKIDWVENIINGDDLFFSVNGESYKFIARVLMYNNYADVAKIYLDKGLDNSYGDPEIHIILADYYLSKNNKEDAQKALKNCLRILPEYFPAKKRLAEIN